MLDSAAKEAGATVNNDTELMEVDISNSHKRQRKMTKSFKGKESLFNKPMELPQRFKKINRIPDYQKNPHKWTKYSLADISQDDMSNESNTAAAMSFLRDVKRKKIKLDAKSEMCSEAAKDKPFKSNLHEFSLPSKMEVNKIKEVDIEHEEDSNKPVFKGSKLIMAEYVVGKVKKPEKTVKKKTPGEKSKEVFLNHIHEYEDE